MERSGTSLCNLGVIMRPLVLLSVFLALISNTWASDMPSMKYKCRAIVGQDWFAGKRNPVYSSSKEFFITEKDYSDGVVLTQKDFTEFMSTEESEASDGKSNFKIKGQTDFKDSDLEKGFEVWMNIRGSWEDTNPKFTHLSLESVLSITPKTQSKEAFSGIRVANRGSGRPETLVTESSIYLTQDIGTTGPIHFHVECKDQLPR